jgi:hypothetical protein
MVKRRGGERRREAERSGEKGRRKERGGEEMRVMERKKRIGNLKTCCLKMRKGKTG